MLCDVCLSSWILTTFRGKMPPHTHTLYACFTFPRLCPSVCTEQLVQNIFVELTELNWSQESSTQEEVLTNKEAEQQLLEVITLASIWRLFGSLFHFIANGIRGSAADNRRWHQDLNPGSLQKPWPSRSTDIDQHREGGGSEIESIKSHRGEKHKAADPLPWGEPYSVKLLQRCMQRRL